MPRPTARPRLLPVLLPLLALLVGVGAGVATAVATRGPAPVSSFNDPLGVGVPLVDLGCTGETVLVVGAGSTSAPLQAAVADNDRSTVRYLRTDESCPTLWTQSADADVPPYVAYLGPYDNETTPCRARMTAEHKRDEVTNLREGNTSTVSCVCVLPTDTLRELTPQQGTDPELGIWVRALQDGLADLDAARPRPKPYTKQDVSGIYDATTEARVRRFQLQRDIVPSTGVVDADTWRALKDRVCPTYDY